MKSKVMSIDDALSVVKDGTRLMLGGFIDVGSPIMCIEKIVEKGVKDLTLIAVTPGMTGFGKSMLYKNKQVKELISSHVGTSAESTKEYLEGELLMKEFFPMGTWIEKVRAGAMGLGGVLVPVGVGILDQPGLFENLDKPKKVIDVDGIKCFVEPALTAEVAIVKAWRADELGNLEYRSTSLNDNADVAMAGKYTIAEVNEIVPVGTISPEKVGTPGVFVNAIVQGQTVEQQDKTYRELWLSQGKLNIEE
ncbi:CoA transferase subunit A [Maledivibacter halophilus]|uniref:Acetate CoA/acetoacetate CoA-transferase alpha subunit n=1 Tax=Maledivibacter halophilus TaxID=36842 RepID=A0A1T5MD71_9FIRM|nr:3-oxoacid CoA-transferase subunit A [Maledivibacter halophilus]SKC86197.1 acetate CoA/acetoacetate CoA-transferase alpha subunit [Maledivibacter halophilus]